MDVEIEQPHTHHPTGHAWLDKVMPISALFVSLISILIAYHHGKVMQELVGQNERLVQANSLPHMTFETRNPVDEKGLGQLNFGVTNGGVGPAEVRGMQVLLDGQPVAGSRELLEKCCGITHREYRRNQILGDMVQAGQSVDYLLLDNRPIMREGWPKIYSAWEANRIETRICYCSVFDECWTRSSKQDARPQRVEACPMPEPQYRS